MYIALFSSDPWRFRDFFLSLQSVTKKNMNMKKLLLLLVVCLSPLMMNAQNPIKVKGSLSLPESEKYLLLKFDFSETVFEKKYNETDWALLNGKEEWEAAKQEALESIVSWMNEKMEKTRIIMVLEKMVSSESSTFKSNYTLYITPESYSKNGKNKSLFVLKNNETGEILGTVATYEGGGVFGSLGNLLGEGYDSSSPEVAKKIAKDNKIKK